MYPSRNNMEVEIMKTGTFELIEDGKRISCIRMEFENNGGGREVFCKAFTRLSITDRKFLFDNVDRIMIEFQMGCCNRPERCALIIPEILVAVFTLAGLFDCYAIAGACAERILGKNADSPFLMERWYVDSKRWGFPSSYRSYVSDMRCESVDTRKWFYEKSPLEDKS